MIESLEIKNFRCYEHVHLAGLSKVNIVVGKNASGKTALLEALFLAAGNGPGLLFKLREWRGGPNTLKISNEAADFDALWKDFFYRLDQGRQITIELTSKNERRELRIFRENEQKTLFPFGENKIVGAIANPLTFVYTINQGDPIAVSARATPGGLEIPSANVRGINAQFFASQEKLYQQQFAEAFSTLSKRKRSNEITDVLKAYFDFIEDISVEIDAGMPALYANVKNLPEKIPISLVSAGINKLVFLLLAIATSSGGFIVVDEIENGLHYSIMKDVWSLILIFAERHDVQIFASTHSEECLQAAAKAFHERPSLIALVQTNRINGHSGAMTALGKHALAAIETGIEIRS